MWAAQIALIGRSMFVVFVTESREASGEDVFKCFGRRWIRALARERDSLVDFLAGRSKRRISFGCAHPAVGDHLLAQTFDRILGLQCGNLAGRPINFRITLKVP